MLNRIGPDYDLHTIGLWLSRDPSLPLGIVIALIVYFAGKKFGFLRTITAIGVVASVPLVVWVWDIPFTHRIVCSSFHDSKLRLPDGTIVTSLWIYVLSAILFVALMIFRYRRRIT